MSATSSSTNQVRETYISDRFGDSHLTRREVSIVALIATGLKNKDIAIQIGCTHQSVKNYTKIIYDKLGVWDRFELTLWYQGHKDELNQEPSC